MISFWILKIKMCLLCAFIKKISYAKRVTVNLKTLISVKKSFCTGGYHISAGSGCPKDYSWNKILSLSEYQ